MPLDVIMPALGMAQDTGVILTWHKSAGDPVTEGDALFEVETDKAAMEVEAQGSGYLTDVTAAAGEEVPVGKVLARISETPEDTLSASASSADPQPEAKIDAQPAENAEGDNQDDPAIPEGESVIMPALGMTQDTGLIVAWLKAPGDAVSAADILFEVETDKSVVEVEAGHDGFVAALLAEKGEEAPVGGVIAIISPDKPETPISRSIKAGKPKAKTPDKSAPEPEPVKTAVPAHKPQPQSKPGTPRPAPSVEGRILASPKARRLALERGLDLSKLADHGYPQPYHFKDLDILESLPKAPAPRDAAAAASHYLTAEVESADFDAFAAWAAEEADLTDASTLLAAFAGTSLGRKTANVALEAFGETRIYTVHGRRLGNLAKAEPDTVPDLKVRDLRFCRLSSVKTGPEDVPVISVLAADDRLKLTLECGTDQIDASTAINLLSDFAGRLEQPLRHLL